MRSETRTRRHPRASSALCGGAPTSSAFRPAAVRRACKRIPVHVLLPLCPSLTFVIVVGACVETVAQRMDVPALRTRPFGRCVELARAVGGAPPKRDEPEAACVKGFFVREIAAVRAEPLRRFDRDLRRGYDHRVVDVVADFRAQEERVVRTLMPESKKMFDMIRRSGRNAVHEARLFGNAGDTFGVTFEQTERRGRKRELARPNVIAACLLPVTVTLTDVNVDG